MLPTYREFQVHALEQLATGTARSRDGISTDRCPNINTSTQQQQAPGVAVDMRAQMDQILLAHKLRRSARRNSSCTSAIDTIAVTANGTGVAWMQHLKRSVAAAATHPQQTQHIHAYKQVQRRHPQHPSLVSTAAIKHNSRSIADTNDKYNLDRVSTSKFIPLLEHHYETTHASGCDTVSTSNDTAIQQQQQQRRLFPFELVVELEAARDLLHPSRSAATDANTTPTRVVVAVLSVMHATQTITTQTVVSRPFAPATIERSDAVCWDAALVCVGIDPDAAAGIDDSCVYVCCEPQRVIDDWSVRVRAWLCDAADADSTTPTCVLGKLDVPLALLETPLATAYAMARWFPLERVAPGASARGDVRLHIHYSMRTVAARDSASESRLEMVPYAPLVQPTSAVVAAPRAKKPREPRGRTMRVKQQPPSTLADATDELTHAIAGEMTNNSSNTTATRSQRERLETQTTAQRRRSVDLDAATARDGNNARCSRLSTARSTAAAAAARTPTRPSRLSRTTAASDTDAGAPAAVSEASLPSSSSSTRSFLKRKQYKVVFHKLDWSQVAARTDSSWDAANPTPAPTTNTTPLATAAVSSTPVAVTAASDDISEDDSSAATARTQAKRSKPPIQPAATAPPTAKQSNKAQRTDVQSASSAVYAVASPASLLHTSTTTTTAAALDAATAQRLRELRDVVLTSCSITQATAPLALLKYQNERNCVVEVMQASLSLSVETTIATTESNTLHDRMHDAVSSAANKANSSCDTSAPVSALASKPALATLWRTLVRDASGEHYAVQLQHLQSGARLSLERNAPS